MNYWEEIEHVQTVVGRRRVVARSNCNPMDVESRRIEVLSPTVTAPKRAPHRHPITDACRSSGSWTLQYIATEA